MSILNDNIAIGLTTEQKAKQDHKYICTMFRNIRDRIEEEHNIIWNIIWNNERGLTAQEVLDDFGTDAYDLFLFSNSIQSLLSEADPEYNHLVTPSEYTVNTDGTITIGTERV